MPRPSRPVQFAIAEQLSHLDAGTWTSLTRDAGVFMKPRFLSALERACPANVSPRYALMSRDGVPLAAMVLQLVRVQGRLAISQDAPLGAMAQLVDERALVLGNLAGWGQTGLALAEGADGELVWREALGLLDRVRRFERPEGVINVSFVKDALLEEHEPALRHQGFQRAPSGPDMVLDLAAFTSFDEYLGSLASKRRRSVKKTLEAVEQAGYVARPLSLEELRAHETRLDALYGEVWSNADVRPLRLTGRFFVELQAAMGADCVVLGLMKGAQLDGFGVCLRSGDAGVGYYLGFDRSVEAPLYQRLLTNIVEQGCAWRCSRMSMGRTTEEPKVLLGAKPGSPGLWVKHRTPPFNWAVGTLLGTIEPPKVPEHHVFKEVR